MAQRESSGLGKTQEGLLRVSEATERLAISRRTLYRLIDAGELVPVYLDRRPRFDPEDLRALIARRRADTA